MAEVKAPSGGGNVLTRKLGPLPTWGWVGIFAGGVIIWAAVKGRKKGGTTTDTSPAPIVVQQQAPFPPMQVVIRGEDEDEDEDEKERRHRHRKKHRHRKGGPSGGSRGPGGKKPLTGGSRRESPEMSESG